MSNAASRGPNGFKVHDARANSPCAKVVNTATDMYSITCLRCLMRLESPWSKELEARIVQLKTLKK